MLTTVFFAFLSGIVTIASPCVLPVLPFLLSGAIGGRLRPYGIVVGFALSFTLFTLFLSGLVQLLGISSDVLRLISVGLLFVFGLVLLVPWLHAWFVQVSSNATSSLSGRLGGVGQTAPNGFAGGVLVGATLGALWTPCVGPIMASVITLALANQVGVQAFLTTLAFSLGTSVSMLAVMLGGRGLLARVGWLVNNLTKVQRGFGVVLVVFALGMSLNLDRTFQTWVLDTFPGYSDFLVGLESLGTK